MLACVLYVCVGVLDKQGNIARALKLQMKNYWHSQDQLEATAQCMYCITVVATVTAKNAF